MKLKIIKKHDYPDIPIEQTLRVVTEKQIQKNGKLVNQKYLYTKENALVSIDHKKLLKKFYLENPIGYKERYELMLIEYLKYIFKKYPKLKEDDTFRGLIESHDRLCKALEA